ncbi:hypothetical protein BOTBODRAFT_39016 [Botryobasidium botryosum FD-172 SS1]|uniref:Uncharacterized protein n=1 Tax=Botryobasidium botryosum (strain FD-172 SS1) TaxID=930990 RepID=A0A067M6G3_BOTB1|nr:hypothetical protein BOTBODRAFT_39016 [Botryobasidium botryosum FD-172 SS1]
MVIPSPSDHRPPPPSPVPRLPATTGSPAESLCARKSAIGAPPTPHCLPLGNWPAPIWV